MAWAGTIVTAPLGMAIAYAVLNLFWLKATAWITAVLSAGTPVTQSVEDNFLWIASRVPAPNLPPLSVLGALDVAALCAVALVVTALLRKNAPLPLWFQANVIVLMLASLWAFFEGRVAYDGPTFMLLLERTSVIMILCAPIFSAVVCALLPFSPMERALMMVMLIAFDFAMSLIRLAAFALLLSHFGVVIEANLYMFFGPLIDVVYFIQVYSFVVVSLSRRIARGEHEWDWL